MEGFIYQAIAIAVLLLFPAWRIFQRAGLNPTLSFTLFIPIVGMLFAGLVLALSTWNLQAETEGEE